MRFHFLTLLPVILSLATWASAENPGDQVLEAREMVDDVLTRSYDHYSALLERREALSDLSTRELLEELEDRLEARKDPPRPFVCGCGLAYSTQAAKNACLNSLRVGKAQA
ncbi:hypothetical protein MD484_g3698, partial [Candolleomyces efflorescens]